MRDPARRPRSRNGRSTRPPGGRPPSVPGGDRASLRSLPRAALAVWIALAALTLARGALAFVPSMWLWGLGPLRFLAPLPAWAPWGLAALALVPLVARPFAAGVARLGDAIARRPLASALGWGACGAALAWLLPDRVHFTGDFQLRLEALEAGTISIGRWTPVALPLDLALHQGLVKLFHDAFGVDWNTATRILGAIEAGLLGALATRFARALALDGAAAASASAIVLGGGSLPLFTGYDKSFMELTLLTAVAGIWGIEMVRAGRGAIPLGLAAAAGFALHRSSLALLVGAGAAWALARRPGVSSTPARRVAIAAFGVILPAGVLAAMAPLMLAALQQYDPVHLATAGTPAGVLAAAFAPVRLLDLANLVLQLSPLAITAPILFALDRGWPRREGLFLLALLAPYLAAMLFVHPHQGMFRDVDDFAAAGMALSLLTAWLVSRALAPREAPAGPAHAIEPALGGAARHAAPPRTAKPGAAPAHAWLAVAIVLGVAAPPVQWMLHFSDLDRGFARVRALAEEPPARSEVVLAKTWDFLGMRNLRLQRWREGAEALEQAARYSPSSRIFVQWAICEMRSGDHAAANALFERALEKNPDDYFAWHELAVTALALDRRDQGRRAAGEMLRLAPGDPDARLVLEEIARREQAGSARAR